MRFGILSNSLTVQQWQFESIRILLEAGHECALIILNGNTLPKKSLTVKIKTYPYSQALVKLWMRFLLRPDAKRETNLKLSALNAARMRCRTQKKGYSEYFESTDIEQIKKFKLDFILRFGFSIIKGEILNSAKYGVWSYHHDDELKYRGVPTGFWEIYYDDPVNAAVLQRLTDKVDGGIILRKGFFKTVKHSWQGNLDNLLNSTVGWPLQACRDIETGNLACAGEQTGRLPEIYKLPANPLMIKFLWKLFLNKVRFHARDLFVTESWNIGFRKIDPDLPVEPGNYSLTEAKWLNFNDKKSVYYADPAGYYNDGHITLLCERYSYKSRKGTISTVKIETESGKIISENSVLEMDYHLAFPFLFHHNGTKYCIPENSENNSVKLYKLDNQSGALIFEKTLIGNLQAVDPVLVEYDNKFWLFFTDKISTNERLHIWFSEAFDMPFRPHANNPVKTDIRSARPAGNLFILNGSLMRPAQDCSVRSGGRIRINKIVELTTTTFREEEFAVINPDPRSAFRDGMHTFCVSSDLLIFDGKHEKFVWQAFSYKFRSKFKKLIRQ